jgi:hypothetical protein
MEATRGPQCTYSWFLLRLFCICLNFVVPNLWCFLYCQGEEYKLFWPDQQEFVRMAARFGATIVPFGVVGEDDIADVSLCFCSY